jgi:hypothetical protein
VDVIRPLLTRLDDDAEVGRRLAVVGRGRRGGVGERLLEAVREAGRPFDRLAVIVEVGDLDVLDQVLDLILAEPELHQVAVGEQRQRMTGRADLVIDLIAALGGGAVIGAERPLEVPVAVRRLRLRFRRRNGFAVGREGAGGEGGQGDGAGNDVLAHLINPPS